MYDKQEAAVFKPVVFNADNDKRVELVMHPEGGEIASFQSFRQINWLKAIRITS